MMSRIDFNPGKSERADGAIERGLLKAILRFVWDNKEWAGDCGRR
jgi:hypothetical protein